MKIELGTEITGCFGAMHSEWIGKVVAIDTTMTPECKVKWDGPAGGHTWMLLSEIRDDYFDCTGKSGIGYFAVDIDRVWDALDPPEDFAGYTESGKLIEEKGTPAEESRLWKR